MKHYIKKRDEKNDTKPMRQGSYNETEDYGKSSGTHVRENSLFCGYIEGSDRQMKEMSKIMDEGD